MILLDFDSVSRVSHSVLCVSAFGLENRKISMVSYIHMHVNVNVNVIGVEC